MTSTETLSVDGEIVVYNGTTGVVVKSATNTGIIKASAGVIATAVDGTDYFSSSYAIPNANIGTGLSNANQATQSITFSATANTYVYITRSNIAIPATTKTGSITGVGTRISWILNISKTAGSFTVVVGVFRGINGSLSDTRDTNATATYTGTTTAVTDNLSIFIDLVITAYSTTATGSYFVTGFSRNALTNTTGFGMNRVPLGASVTNVITAPSTSALNYGLGIASGTAAANTVVVQKVTVQTFNLA